MDRPTNSTRRYYSAPAIVFRIRPDLMAGSSCVDGLALLERDEGDLVAVVDIPLSRHLQGLSPCFHLHCHSPFHRVADDRADVVLGVNDPDFPRHGDLFRLPAVPQE